MTAFSIGMTRFNRDHQDDRSFTGPLGTFTVTDPGPQHLSGLYAVRGPGRKEYVAGLDAARRLARTMAGLEAA